MVERPIQHEAQPSTVWVSRPQPECHVLNDKTHIMCFIVTSKLQFATETVQAVALRAYS